MSKDLHVSMFLVAADVCPATFTKYNQWSEFGICQLP